MTETRPPSQIKPLDRAFALEAVRVTEAAAIAAFAQVGRGNEHDADQAAVEAMRAAFNALPIDGTVVIGCASDGLDNGPAAGGIADFKTKEAAKRLGLSGDAYLAKNDSFPFMKKTGSQIMTGLTEINISDLMLALRKKV